MLPAQTSFAAGEISPRLFARVDTKGYKEGAEVMENMISIAQGPAARRGGIRFAVELPPGIVNARLVPFPVASDDYFIGVFYDQKLLMLNSTGGLITVELVQNSSFTLGSANWTAIMPGGATVVFGVTIVTLTSAGANIAAIRQLVTGLSIGASYRLQATQVAPNDLVRLRVGTTAGGFEVAQTTSALTAPTLPFVATATQHWIEVASLTPGVALVLSSVSVQATGLTPTPISSPIQDALLRTMQFEMAPEGNIMVIVSGGQAPQELKFIAPNTFTLTPIVFTAPPADWVPGNYPRTVTFHQGRLWLGGTATKPASFWASQSNLYYNFTLGVLASDALAFTIAKRGAIRWMVGAKQMLIGTDAREFVITGGDGTEVITPTSISIQPQSAYGSFYMQPPLLGNLVLYPSADGRRIYSMGFRFEESGWVSTDLSFAAQHITSGVLAELAFAQSPENILWAIDLESKLIGMSYDRDNKIVGWHKHPTPGFAFISVCTVKFIGTDIIWFAIRLQRGLEVVTQIGVLPGAFALPFLDMQKLTVAGAPQTVFPGYQHLKGLTVKVIADGAVHPPVVVSAGGDITLQAPATQVLAGLEIKARLKTLPIEVAAAEGSTQTFHKRKVRTYVQLLSSGKPYINGKRPPDRTPSTPMDTIEPLSSGRVFDVGLGYDLIQQAEIMEDDPIQLVVGGIFYALMGEGAAK